MLAIRWELVYWFFTLTGIMFWAILFFGGVITIVSNISRILNDKNYQEYMENKADKRIAELKDKYCNKPL